jgi:PAS domain S-box-containing protein
MTSEHTPVLPVSADGRFSGVVLYEDLVKYLETAEETLIESENKYAFLFNTVTDCVWVFSLDKVFKRTALVDVNRSVCDKLGFSKDELLRLGADNDFTAGLGELLEHRITEFLQGKTVSGETVLKARDGRQLHLELNLQATVYNGDDVVVAVGRDISRRKELEGKLRNSDMLFPISALVIDNDGTARKRYEKLLKNEIAAVSVCTNGAEALKLIQDTHFDLIIIDMHMQGMNGTEIAKQIRDLEGAADKKTVIAALSGDDSFRTNTAFMNAGADSVLQKPLNIYHLRTLIGRFFLGKD